VLTVQSGTSAAAQDGLQEDPVNADVVLKDAQQTRPGAQLLLPSHVSGA
jgi:hypothetical protein